MIRAALVSYLNTKPFLEGLANQFGPETLSMDLLPPSQCAVALRNGKADIALVPVGSLFDAEGLKILGDFCIGAEGKVDTVMLFSDCPIEEVTEVVLDPHSMTSNLLTEVLFGMHWTANPDFIRSPGREFSRVQGTRAAVTIGDQAHKERGLHAFEYDLGQVWLEATGLPFVFAVWAYHPDKITQGQLTEFHKALGKGVADAEGAAKKYAQAYGYTEEEAIHYLTKSIHFHLDASKKEGFHTFFQWVRKLNLGPMSRLEKPPEFR